MATRSVSLVDRLELEFQGTIYKNSIAFGDVDGDGGNELLICNTAGQLYIFKGKSTKPWKTCPSLGCVTCIIVGDIKNEYKNAVLCLNTEGSCFVFDQIDAEGPPNDHQGGEATVPGEKSLPSKSPKSSPAHMHAEIIRPSCKLDLPANPKMAILADIDGDGLNELAVCYTDRNVRIFRWEEANGPTVVPRERESHPSTSTKKQDHKLVKQSSKDEDGKLSTSNLVKQPSKDSGTSGNHSPRSPMIENATRKDSKQMFDFESLAEGKFVMIRDFTLPGQVGSVAVVKLPNGARQLVASQPAGGYAILAVYANGSEDFKDSTELGEPEDNAAKNDPKNPEQPCVYYPASHYRLRNFKVESEVLGNIKRENGLSGLFCVCTVDGSYFVINNTENGVNILPISTTTEHKWFAMDQLDIGIDGNDAIVLCSWEGMTYVIDKDFHIISYSFGDHICGFRAGMFAVEPHINVPCFGYVTFLNRLVLYYDVSGVSLKSNNFHETVLEKLKSKPEYGTLLKSLENEHGRIDPSKLRTLIRSALA